jgi:hypothetical protein
MSITEEQTVPEELQQSRLSKAEEGGGWVAFEDKPSEEDLSLPAMLSSAESSFLSTAAGEEVAGPAVRRLVTQLQEKLERDRSRYSEKVKSLQLKLVNARSSYEKELWRCKLERNQLERTFRLDTNELKLALDKASLARKRDSLLIEELKTRVLQLEETLQREQEAKAGLHTRYKQLEEAYETSQTALQEQARSLSSQLQRTEAENAKLQTTLAGAQGQCGELEATVFQLDQEVKRLKAIPVWKCAHEEELIRLREEKEKEEQARREVEEAGKRRETVLQEKASEAIKTIEVDRAAERVALERIVEELRTELQVSRQAVVTSQTLAEQLSSRRPQRDLSRELAEANEENLALGRELRELREREEAQRLVREQLEQTVSQQNLLQSELGEAASETQRQLERDLGLAKAATKEALAAAKAEREKSSYLEAELSVNLEMMKTLRFSQEASSKEVSLAQMGLQEELQRLHALAKDTSGNAERLAELEAALHESESNCESLEAEARVLVERFREEREAWELEKEEQEACIQSLLEENQTLKDQLEAVRVEQEESERLLTETVSKLPPPRSSDLIDQLLRDYMQSHRLKNPFVRLAEGLYTFGTKKVSVTVKNGSIIVRVGGGYMFLEEFLRLYLPKETERKVQLVISPHSRSQSVGTDFKRAFTLTLDRLDSFPTPQQSTDSPPKSQRSVRDPSPSLYQPTVSSQNKKAVVSPPATGKVFRAFQIKKQ